MSDQPFTHEAIEAEFGFKSHWLSTREGERIHYLDEGNPQGVPVIFIHGAALGITSAANFFLNIRAVAEAGYRVLGPDLYGHGWTETPAGVEPDILSQVEQIHRFMDGMKIDKAYLIGNSLGGRIAARVIIERPERYLGCVLVGAGGAVWPEPRFPASYTPQQAPTQIDRDTMTKAMHRLAYNPDMVSEKLLAFRTRMALRPGELGRNQHAAANRAVSAAATVLDEAAAAKCLVPLLIVCGREDRVGPPENALACAQAFPNADLVVFGHCGHWAMVERAEDFNASALRFFAGQDRRIVKPPVFSGDLMGRNLPSV